MKKSIISLLSASIISMSLVGCQSTKETNLDEYLSNNIDETIWILNAVYDNGQQIFNDPNEPTYYEGTIDDALNNEKDYTYVAQKLDNLYNEDISAYNRLYSYISTNDLNGLKRMYNQYEEDIKTNKTDSAYHILKTIKYATSNFTTTYYIGLNRDYFEAIDATLSDKYWVDSLSEEQGIDEYNCFRNYLEGYEADYTFDYVCYATLCDIVKDSKENTEEMYLCCSCGSAKTNQFFSIINDYMCNDCSKHVQCYDCGNEYNIKSMESFNGRSFHCGCKEEEIMTNTEQEALITEGTCGGCGTTNIDIMDNAGGYICNECGHIGTVSID